MFETQKAAQEASRQSRGVGWGEEKLLEIKQASHRGQCDGALVGLKSGPACGKGQVSTALPLEHVMGQC